VRELAYIFELSGKEIKMNEIQNRIMMVMSDSSLKGKQKLSPVDLGKKLGLSLRKIRSDLRTLVEQRELGYWSSGSGNYYMLKEDFESLKKLEESNQ
jgi:hypothetical protein